jgi:hypothetical protein
VSLYRRLPGSRERSLAGDKLAVFNTNNRHKESDCSDLICVFNLVRIGCNVGKRPALEILIFFVQSHDLKRQIELGWI